MKTRIRTPKVAFAAAIAAALTYGAGSALAQERGARDEKHYYCFSASTIGICQNRCAAEGHQWDSYWKPTCCCVDL